jgi:hypothetical protein
LILKEWSSLKEHKYASIDGEFHILGLKGHNQFVWFNTADLS